MTPAIETLHLCREFREPRRLLRRAPGPVTLGLTDVSVRIETGECVALVGPNGAGKSTLLRVLATLFLPTSGSARVAGHDVLRDAPAVRRAVGVMNSDDRSFFWRLTGHENLTFFAELQGLSSRAARHRASEALEQVGLLAAGERRFAGYSTGMRQRLGFARALLHHPRVLLLDEPTSNLDLEHRGQVLVLLRAALASGDVTALIASHDAGLTASLAQRVIRLDQGHVAERGTSHTTAHYLLRVRGLSDQQLVALGTLHAACEHAADIEVVDLGDGHALSAAVAAVVAGGGEVLDVRPLTAAEVPR